MENTYNTIFRDDNSNLLELSDVTLHTEDGQSFAVHRYELAKNNKYFFALFCGLGKGKKDILIPGINGDILSNVLSYIYSGQVHATKENFCELVISADYLLLSNLLLHLKSLLKNVLSISNAIAIYATAMRISTVDISQETFRFVETHFEEILYNKPDDFYELAPDSLKQLLYDRNLRVRSESVVWSAAVAWVEADVTSRLHHVPDLLMCLKIGDVDEDLATLILTSTVISKNEFCKKMDLENSAKWSNLLKLQLLSILNNQTQISPHNVHRTPRRLHFIARRCGTENTEIFVTYDENTDMWRKVTEITQCPDDILFLNDYIYVFKNNGRKNYRFSIVDKQWLELPSFRIPRYLYSVVKLQGCIYVLGGFCEVTDNEMRAVEVFKAEENMWYELKPMPAISFFAVAVLYKLVYAVGNRSITGLEMIALVYYPNIDLWTEIPEPSVNRFNFAFVAYHEKIYAIGGSNEFGAVRNVEVFDPVSHTWNITTILPYAYYSPKTAVINDKLIVYDNSWEDDHSYVRTTPPVQWDSDHERWVIIEESSPLFKLHLYKFFSVEEREGINIISKENKDPATTFEQCPFCSI